MNGLVTVDLFNMMIITMKWSSGILIVCIKWYKLCGVMVTVAIGMEKYNKKIPSVYYRDAVGALLVYDVTNLQSLTSLKQWWQDACDVVMKKDGQPIPAVILANKVVCSTNMPSEWNVLL